MAKRSKQVLKVHDGGKEGAVGRWITEEHKLPFAQGAPKIFRTRNSGENWSFSMWVKEEKKYLTQALHTQIKSEALQKAEDLYIETRAHIKEGRKATKISLAKLVERYLVYVENRVTKSLITKGRYDTIKSRMKAVQNYLPKNKSLSSLSQDDFLGYTAFRQQSGVTLYVITQERSEIKSLFRWAVQNGYLNPYQIPIFEELRRGIRSPRRDYFLPEEYQKCFVALRRLVRDTKAPYDKMIWGIFRDLFLIGANSGIRFGEMRRLRWRDIRRMYRIEGEDQHPDGVVELFLPADITKTRMERTVVATAVPYFKRLRKLYGNPPPDQLIFADPKDPSRTIAKTNLYRLWEVMLKEAGLGDRQPRLTFYSLRHFYATLRILKGVPIYDLSLTMGCSVNHIESHYSHIKTSQVAGRITRFRSDDLEVRTSIPDFG